VTRNIFEWETPPGVSITQVFPTPRRQLNGSLYRPVEFVATCATCGAASEARQSRADAIDEVEALCAARHPNETRGVA
jgi:hypothetical protein